MKSYSLMRISVAVKQYEDCFIIPGPVYFINNLNAASRKSLEIQVYSKSKI